MASGSLVCVAWRLDHVGTVLFVAVILNQP